MAMGSVVYALGVSFETNDLSRWVLQANELPQGFQTVVDHELSDAQSSPLEVGEFSKGYRLEGWLYPYPEGSRGKFYVANLVYRFSSSEQAIAQFEHKLKELETTVNNVKVSAIDYDESLAREQGLSGRALRFQADLTEAYWFLGVQDRTLVFLMLDNWSPEIADTEVQYVFVSLLESLLQR
jgi:hypothetical protein